MEKQKTILSENTLIPISLLVTLLFFSAWLTSVYAQGLKNSEHIVELKQDRKDDMDYIRQELRDIKELIKK
jgi:hypothetical protein